MLQDGVLFLIEVLSVALLSPVLPFDPAEELVQSEQSFEELSQVFLRPVQYDTVAPEVKEFVSVPKGKTPPAFTVMIVVESEALT